MGALKKAAQSARTPGPGGVVILFGFLGHDFVFMRAIMGRGVGHLWSYPSKKNEKIFPNFRRFSLPPPLHPLISRLFPT